MSKILSFITEWPIIKPYVFDIVFPLRESGNYNNYTAKRQDWQSKLPLKSSKLLNVNFYNFLSYELALNSIKTKFG